MTDELKPSPEAVLTKLTEDHGYTVYHDPEDDELTITQTRFYEVQYGDLNFAVSVSELNEPNQWNDAAMDGFCAHFEAALVIDRALRPATMPGDVVEMTAREVMSEYLGLPVDECDAGSRGGLLVQEGYKRALTAMQPAIQAAVDALGTELRNIRKRAKYLPDEDAGQLRINCDKIDLFAEAAQRHLASLRGATEQGEG